MGYALQTKLGDVKLYGISGVMRYKGYGLRGVRLYCAYLCYDIIVELGLGYMTSEVAACIA